MSIWNYQLCQDDDENYDNLAHIYYEQIGPMLLATLQDEEDASAAAVAAELAFG